MKNENRKEKPLRYIAYVRKSEEREERQELSHESQKENIQQYFPDLNIVKWMDYESKSAFHPGRPIFDEMLQLIEDGFADGIVAWHPNRLSRNEIDSGRLTYMLRTKLKDSVFCTYRFDNTPEGILVLQNLMNHSQYESSKQGRDVKRGMETKAMRGERPGQVPQGYIKVPLLDENGVLIKKKEKIATKTESDGERFEMVQRMWRMLLSGVYSPPQIRKIANNDWKYRTRRTQRTGDAPLTASMIYKIFNNPFYAGYILHNGEMYEGNHVPMITLKEFDYAQTLLGAKGQNRHGTYMYAFSSMIRCGVCDCLVGGKTNVKLLKSTNARKVYVHYYCTRKSEHRPCNQRIYTSLELIEDQIQSELQKYTILPEFRDLALKILRRNNKIEIKERKQVYESQQKRRSQIQDQLDKLIDMRTRDMLDDDEFMSQKRILKNELVRIDDLLRSTEKRADNWLELTEEAFDFATYAAIRFKTTDDPMVKRHILATLGANLTLKDQKLTITPNEWLIPIAEGYPALEKAYLNARTNKNSSSPDREKLFEEIFQSWRARRDSNPRHPA